MGLVGILIGLGLLMWLAYRGRSVLLVAPLAALVAAAFSGEPLLAHWTQTFMGGAARFIAQWFPMFLLGGLFGKLMQDSGSISAIAQYLTKQLGTKRTMLSVVIASAVVTYGGVSVFVAFFVLVPMAQEMFRAANIPRRLATGRGRPRRIYVHHVGDARNPFSQQRHSDAVPRHYDFRGPRAEHHRVDHHLHLRHVVAPACRVGGAQGRRRLRFAMPETPPVIDEKTARAGGTSGQLRPGRVAAWQVQHQRPLLRAGRTAARRRHRHKFPNVARRASRGSTFRSWPSTSGAGPRSGQYPASGRSSWLSQWPT